MALQENVNVSLIYGIQADINTLATAGGTSQALRRTTINLNGMKDAFSSNEVRTDQMISDMRHGARRVGGGFEGELSTVAYDDFLLAVQRGASWTTGPSLSESDFTSLAVSSGVITLGSGNPSTLGLRVGHLVDFTNMSVAGNNTRARIIAMTATTITTYPALADQSADTACNIDVVGKYAVNGTSKHAFTLEERHATIDVSKLYKHCRLNSAAVRIPPNGMASIGFDVMGRDFSFLDGGSAPYFTSVTAAPNTNLMTGIEGGLRFGGAEQAVVTGAEINIAHNMSAAPVIGSNLSPEIFYGRLVVTGNISFFLESKTLLDLFDAETETELHLICTGADDSFLTFIMPRIKLGAANTSPTGDGGVIAQCPFQALLKSAGTGFDQTTLMIQRSNS